MGIHVGIDFVEQHLTDLLAFVYEATQHGYGSENIAGDENTTDGSSKIPYENGDWRFLDTYYGGEPYSGMSTVFYKGVSCWTMIYYGRVLPHVDDKQYVYDCLCPALLAATKEYPFRGPANFVADNGLIYENYWDGNITSFCGSESITDSDGVKQFETCYAGGLVNLR